MCWMYGLKIQTLTTYNWTINVGKHFKYQNIVACIIQYKIQTVIWTMNRGHSGLCVMVVWTLHKGDNYRFIYRKIYMCLSCGSSVRITRIGKYICTIKNFFQSFIKIFLIFADVANSITTVRAGLKKWSIITKYYKTAMYPRQFVK